MDKRRLGRSDLWVSPFAFGGNVFGWTIDAAMSHRLLDAFVDAGGNMIDTSDVYSAWVPGNSGGESETIIGDWLATSGRRNQVIIATKVGLEYAPGAVRQAYTRKRLRRDVIERAVEASLRRLRIETIDLYQSHFDDPQTPIAETLEAYASLIKRGLVRHIGASNYGRPAFAEALRVAGTEGKPRYQSQQILYNLYDRSGFENDMRDMCLANEIGVITYFSLASGFLTGKHRTPADLAASLRGDGLGKYLNARGYRILDALAEVAAAQRATSAQIALAWLLAQSGVTAALCSATNPVQLAQLIDALRIDLDPEALQRLNEASRPEAPAA